MEKLIQFFDWKKSSHTKSKRKLHENQFAVWYNKKNANYSVTINNLFKTDKEFVRFGKLGDSIVMVFNNEEGSRVNQVGAVGSKNVHFCCVDFVQMFFGEMKEEKERKVFSYSKINNDILAFSL